MGRAGRREFLKGTAGVAGSLLAGCGSEPANLPGDAGLVTPDARDAELDTQLIRPEVAVDAKPGCADPFAGGTRMENVAFVGEGSALMETELGAGLDGRLYTDLTRLTPETLLIPNERFYIRTLVSDLLPATGDWQIAVRGLVESDVTITVESFGSLVEPMGVHLMECSGNAPGAHFGLLSAASWDGIPIAAVLARGKPLGTATRVRISGFDRYSMPSSTSTEGASWVFTVDQLVKAGAFLATRMNGVPLPTHHGFPIRLLVPGWYGCTCIKWVNEITFVDDGEPSTAHMREFASRTHQTGTPPLAKDYQPANIQHAAMPVRIERWSVAGKPLYRVFGVLWGGASIASELLIRFGLSEPWVPVDFCPKPSTQRTWTTWAHAWSPKAPGNYRIQLRLADATIPTRRLDSGYYARSVTISG